MSRLAVHRLVVAPDGRPRRPLDLTLTAGEAVAVTGASGAGKSSVLRALVGLDAPSSGEVKLEGKTLSEWGPGAFRRRMIYLTQRAHLPAESVRDALARPFAYRSAEGLTFSEATAKTALVELGLPEDVLERPAGRLSVGEAQRVALVRALLLAPLVLLADEPTSALDPEAATAVETRLRRFIEDGGSLVLVSHDPEQRARLAPGAVDVEVAS